MCVSRTADGRLTAADLDEYELMVARVAHEKVTSAAGVAPFAAALDAFLANDFVPTFRKALKRKGIIVPEAPPPALTQEPDDSAAAEQSAAPAGDAAAGSAT